MKHTIKLSSLILVMALMLNILGITLAITAAHAAPPLLVTKTADTNDGVCDSDCSLREAIATAAPGNTINFDTPLSGQTIFLGSTLALAQNVTIDGTGLIPPITISGDTNDDDNTTPNVQVMFVGSVTVTLDSLIITEGGTASDGAGIFNSGGTLTINNSTISDNSTTGYGGGISNTNASSTLIINNSTLSGNSATSGGGAIHSGGPVTVTNSTISGNSTGSYGGGIFTVDTLTVTNSTLSGNTSGSIGGAMYEASGTATITNSTLSGNTASSSGGGIYSNTGTLTITDSTFKLNNASLGSGGGIYNFGSTVNVNSSTFDQNGASGSGGGIYNFGGTLNVANSTFSGNGALYGGAIINYGPFTITNSTLSGNTATNQGGGIYDDTTPLNYANTIIADSPSGGDCYSVIALGTNTNNLVKDGSCSGTAGDPNLGPLASNGGPTQTFALLAGSVAIDTGDNTVCAAAPVNNRDQRGIARPDNLVCDIGAYEFDHSYDLDVTGTYSYTTNNPAMSIATGLTAISTPSGGTLDGAIVVIGSGFQAGDTLSATDSGGVTSSYNATTGVLTLSGTADVSVYQTVLGSVKFSTASTNTTPRTVTYSLGTALPDDGTGNFYELVSNVLDWDSANTAATARAYFGRAGYLATITSNAERSFVGDKVSDAHAWLGGSGFPAESVPTEYRWVTGPEGLENSGAGRTFWTQADCAVGLQGICAGTGQYNYWEASEPSLGAASQRVWMGYQAAELWDDTPKTNTAVVNGGYVVEYGGLPGDSPMDIDGSVTVNVSAAPAPTPTRTRTPAVVVTPTRTRTPTVGPSLTRTPTATPAPITVTFISNSAQDGRLIESSENSELGGSSNVHSGGFRLGDTKLRQQYRGLISFTTGSLPDNAIISKVILKVKVVGVGGSGDPVTIFQGFMADIKNGFFGTSAALQITDFQATTSGTYGPFFPPLVSNIYSINLTNGKANINKASSSSGLTQIRLRFKLDDNNNVMANYLRLYSGSTALVADRPKLVITYTLP